jgi:alpha-N-arabinofuranosidase
MRCNATPEETYVAVQVTRMAIDPTFTVGEVDERLFGSFVEHMGRAVYGGIYEPGHATADAGGFRGDVLSLVRELGVSLVRYPGGNFVSAYDWEDGVGPERPQRLDLAWHSVEPNTFGTDEFLRWADLASVQPLLAVNLGTRGIDAARALLEYVNGAPGTKYADRRVANGHAEPYGVKLWCLGNEMDGPWQVGQKTAVEYGRLASETGKAMKWVDPSIELCVVGSSNSSMPTFGHWEDTVLDLTWNVADYISLHTYYDPLKYDDVDAYLRCSQDLDRMIDTVVATADAVAGRKRSRKRMQISVDEWNVWHQTANPHHAGHDGPFKHAPALAEDEHTVADALVVGCLLITLLRHADRVKIGCLAQLVNVIPPIRTLDGGPAWRQTTFHPFAHAARFGHGTVLRVELEGDEVEATAVLDEGVVTVFAVNRSEAARPLDLVVRDLDVTLAEHVVLDGDLAASNTAERPDRVTPRSVSGYELPPRSWNVLRLT